MAQVIDKSCSLLYNVNMTKKDFVLIANVIKNAPMGLSERAAIALDMMEALANTNPRFDKEQFLLACRNPRDMRPVNNLFSIGPTEEQAESIRQNAREGLKHFSDLQRPRMGR